VRFSFSRSLEYQKRGRSKAASPDSASTGAPWALGPSWNQRH